MAKGSGSAVRAAVRRGALGLLATGLATLFPGAVAAQTAPLPYSYAYTNLRDCGLQSCSMTLLTEQLDADYNRNAQSSVANGRGSAMASAAPGMTGTFALPIVKARSTVTGLATATAYALAFQGFRNASSQALTLSFAGALDFTGSGPGYGFVSPSLAILTTAVRDPEIGKLYIPTDNMGGFTATCATPGAIALVSAQKLGTGAQTSTLDTAGGTCGGGSTFSIAPGQDFYVLARLLTYQYLPGAHDASHTFVVDISPLVSTETRAQIAAGALQPISLAAVPEPSSWALLIVGFGAAGATMRRRRKPALA